MRIATVVLSVIAVLLIALVAVFFVGGTLHVDAGVRAVSASEDSDAFHAALSVLASGEAPAVFRSDTIDDPARYQLVDITLSVKNSGIFAAEWVQAEIVPAEADVAAYFESEQPVDLPARGAGELNFKLVTHADGDSARTVAVEYYVLGMRRTVRIAC